MSDSQAYEELTVTSDGVTVVKRFEEDEFPVPAIAFEFTSEREEEVRVVLSDTVPEDIEVEDLGFHPEYGSEYWMIDDDRITFERDLSAGETYTTVYGIRATGSDNVEAFLTSPTIEEVDPPLPGADSSDDIVPQSGDDIVKQAISGGGEIPGLEESDGDADEEVETLDLKDPNAPDEQTAAPEGDTETPTEPPSEITGDSLVAAIAAEIRQQNVSLDDVKLLRRAFEIAEQDGGAMAAKVDQMQRDVTNLRAYTNSLEEFLDENGTGEQLIGEFQKQLSEFNGELSSLESELEANREQIEAMYGDVEGFDDELAAVSDDVESVWQEIDEVTDRVDTVSELVESASEEISSVSEDVEAVSEEVQSVSDEISSVTEDVQSVEDGVESVTNEVESVADKVDEDIDDVSTQVETVTEDIERFDSAIEELQTDIAELEEKATGDDVAEDVEALESELSDLKDWQEQIKATFGG